MTEALALEAQEHWRATGAPRLLSHRENAVYEITLPGGARAALRLHRKGYNRSDEIAAELTWTSALSKAGFPAPGAVRTSDGAQIVVLQDGTQATVVDWVAGAPIGAGGVALAGDLTQQRALYRDVGGLLARLHEVTDRLNLPETLPRRRWDVAGFLGSAPTWGPYLDHPSLTPAEADLLVKASAQARAILEARSDLDFGLIHADGLRENVFRTADGLVLIDYDDSGYGYRLYDIAVALNQALEDTSYDALTASVVEGYVALRPVPEGDLALIPLFAMLRSFAGMGWLRTRVEAGDPAHALYIQRAVHTAERFMARDA